VVETFAEGVVEPHAEPLVDDVELGARERDHPAPDGEVLRVAGLQPDQFPAGGFERGGAGFAFGGGLFVEALHLGDRVGLQRGGVQVAFPGRQQHPELRAPVAQVVVGQDAETEGAVEAVKGIADHSRADVADVHRLGHIGARVIDDHGATVPGVRDAEARRGGECCELLGQPLRGNGQVDETGAGDFGARQHRRQRQGGERCLGHGARRTAQGFGRLHRVVTLEIAKARVGRRLNADARPLLRFAERGPERLPYPLCQLRLTPVHCLIHCKTNLLTSFRIARPAYRD